jgi:hypothetical protein
VLPNNRDADEATDRDEDVATDRDDDVAANISIEAPFASRPL